MEDISLTQEIENMESTEIIENTESPSKKVSIIVPIYNVEKYIGECIESIIFQTFPKEEMQVILVNDGSTDNTAEIIKDYIEMYDFLEYYEKENGGVSEARNYGIRRAIGKYIMFLDADDKFSPEVVEKCVSFFDEHYDEIDIATYLRQRFDKNGDLKIDSRYDRYLKLKSSCIYDLENTPYGYLTTLNIITKNKGEKNMTFKYALGEDTFYNSILLNNKKKYGFIVGCKYFYREDNENSISKSQWPTESFEEFLELYEELFKKVTYWSGCTVRYVQAIFIGVILWKLPANILFPYHYSNEEFKKANARIDALIERVDTDIILNFPNADKFHKHWLLSRKKNLNAYIKKTNDGYGVFYGNCNYVQTFMSNGENVIAVYDFSNKPDILFINKTGECISISESKKLCDFTAIHIIVCKISVINNKLVLYGFAKSEFYNYIKEDADLWATEIYNEGVKEIKLKSFLAWESNYKCRTQTNNFYGFVFECDLSSVRGFRFYIKFRNFATKPSNFWFYPVVGINENRIIRGGYRIDFDGNEYHISLCNTFEENEQLTEKIYKNKLNIYNIRKIGAKLRQNSSIYIYSDMPHIKKDNAYYQFKNDFNKKDGIQRYYISGLSDEEYDDYFNAEEKKYVVKFFSSKHKQLYLAAEKIFTAFSGNKTHCPFKQDEISKFADMFDFEIIYLGHGVINGVGMWQYHAEWGFADKFVISSNMEHKNLVENYHWQPEHLIPTGVPRYNYIDRNVIPVKKILFAPSWRASFAQQNNENDKWEFFMERFKNHIWHKSVYSFLTSQELLELLIEYGYTLDFKPHPIIAGAPEISHIYSKAFGKNGPIRLTTDDVSIEEYAVYITDYSSFVFDFVYLNRAIMYFFPDYDEWRSGIYSFRKVAVPFEEAFGPFTTDYEIAIENLKKILENSAVPEEIYAERMKNFFLPMSENICDDIYDNSLKYIDF